ncbi:MAG: Cna B-type domain-containing protein [Erysipelotrichaceae bacterium]|nr:Cna B-type domain-containing protein [Erysipelotrichaceae bacterium]
MYRVLRNFVISLIAVLMLFHSLSFDGLRIAAEENGSENVTEYVNQEEPATEIVTEEPAAAEQETVAEAVEEVTIMPTEYTAELREVLVKATVAEGTFKEEVELAVDPIHKGTDEYQAAEETLKNDGADFDDMIAFDIYFKVKATGERIEPDENVKVELSLREEAFAEAEAEKIDAETVNVTHITEENEVVKVADTADETAGKVEVTATAEKVEAVEATFTVESFSTFVLTWKNASDQEEKATIHYGTYTDGSFVEFAEETIVLDTGATNVSIANTFEGYTYLSAVYCEPGQTIAEGVDMGEVLFKNGNTWEADTYVSDETTHTTDTVRKTIVNGANIYAIYFKPEKPNPQGGGDENIPSPETTKTVKVNDDGTATITLDIVGKTVQSDESHYANVLIILDATVSMDGAKWTNAKAAMKALIETLSEGDNAGNAGKIDYALVTFGRSATVVQNWTKDNATFKTTCANISMVTTSGTNWEAGMRGGLYGVLNNMPDNDPTYVIFLTDGDPNTWYWTTEDIGSSIPNTWPTQRVSQDNIGDEDFYGASDTYMRPGYQGNSSTAADRSKDEAKKIATGRYLYGIYCGDSGTTPSGTSFNRLVDVITGEGQGGQKAISANADTIESEFKAIAETILNNLGANNVTVDDGVPELSSVSTSVSGAADGFKYYIKEKGAADFSEWTDHPGTAYSENNGVTWDLGNAGTLKDGTTYRLQFKVWPSQEAYDLIADLNNGTVAWDSLSDDVKSQINKSGNTYTLKTNTHLNTTYTFNGKTYTDPGNPGTGAMPLVSSQMNVRKAFAHAINDTSPYSKLNFYLTVDGKYYMSDGSLSETVPTKDSTGYYTVKLPVDESLSGEAFWAPENWTGSVYIAPGFMNGTTVLEKGHKYSLYEVITEGDEYEYEFTPQTVRPMVIDGTLTFLVLKDKYNTNEKNAKEYTIEGETYYVASENNGELVGTNRKTAELDITKIIVDNRKTGTMTEADMNKETFTYRVKLTVDKDADITGITAYEYVQRTGEGRFTIFGYQRNDDADIRAFDEDVTKFSGKTFGAFTVTTPGGGATLAHVFKEDGDKLTATIDITLKPNEIIRFTNLPSGTQYEIEEVYANLRQADPSRNADAVPSTDVASNLAAQGYATTTIKTKHGTATGSVEGTKVTGTIVDLDTRYYNQFTNETSDFVDVELKGTKKLSGYTWITNERYYFNLEADGEAPLPGINGRTRFYLTPTADEVGTAAEKTYSFGKIRFTAAGTYKYTVKEDNAGTTVGGIVYDVAKEITIVIKENDDKTLTVESVTGTDTVWDGEKLVATTTMTNKAEETEVSANKAWKNADGTTTAPSGASVVFSVFNAADMEKAIKAVTLDGTADENGETKAWTATFSNLPKYTYEEVSETVTGDDGKETVKYSRKETAIEYKIKETTTYPDYKVSPEDGVADGGTITNSREVAKLKLTKVVVGDVTVPADATFTVTGPSDFGTKTVKYSEMTDNVYDFGTVPTGTYSVTEKDAEVDGYTLKTTISDPVTVTNDSSGELKVTNEYTRKTGTLKLKKVVVGDATVPADTTFTVTGPSDFGTKTVKYSEMKDNVYDFGKVPTGTYSVTENGADKVEGYTLETTISDPVTVTEDGTAELTVTNTYTKKLYKVTVIKTFVIDDVTKIPADFAIAYSIDGVAQPDLTLKNAERVSDTEYKWVIENVPYASKVAFKEKNYDVAGYALVSAMLGCEIVIGDEDVTWTFNNVYERNKYDVTVTKEFSGITAEMIPEEFQISITVDGKEIQVLKVTDKDVVVEGLKYTWKLNEKIPYETEIKATESGYDVFGATLSEDAVKEATLVVGTGENVMALTNPYTINTFNVEVTKEWDDSDDRDGFRAKLGATVQLYKQLAGENTKTRVGDIVTVGTGADWSNIWKDLPAYENGKLVTYSVEETYADKTLKYEMTIGDPVKYTGKEKETIAIKNTHVRERINVPVEKIWEGDEDYLEYRPEKITVVLVADGKETNMTVELNKDNEWKGSFNDLEKYSAGKEIDYTVKEIDVPAYYQSGKPAGSKTEGYKITNTFAPILFDPPVVKTIVGDKNDTTATFEFEMVAVTEGAPMPKGAADGKITITLPADGKPYEFGEVLITEVGKYEYIIREVAGTDPNYAYDATEYHLLFDVDVNAENELVCQLTVSDGETETIVPWKELSGFPFEFENEYRDYVTLEIEKVWDDGNDAQKLRPEEIEVEVLANGEVIFTVVLNEENEWKYEEVLPFSDDNFKPVTYSVNEKKVPEGYTVSYSQNEYKFTVTNTVTPPETSDASGINMWLAVFGISLTNSLGLAYVSLKRKKEEQF